MPWTCDALLPTAERYASLKYRRVAQYFDPTRLGYADACELVACIGTLGRLACRWIFQWKVTGVAHANVLVEHMGAHEDVLAMIEANRVGQSVADGVAVLAAMRDGGWVQGGLPAIVRYAVLERRAAGVSKPRIAAEFGLTHDQVRGICEGRRDRVSEPISLKDAALFAD